MSFISAGLAPCPTAFGQWATAALGRTQYSPASAIGTHVQLRSSPQLLSDPHPHIAILSRVVLRRGLRFNGSAFAHTEQPQCLSLAGAVLAQLLHHAPRASESTAVH